MKTRISPGRIGRWSASHPWRALLTWFVFVATCVALGAATGTKTLSDGAVGESAQGNAVMDAHGLWGPPREYAYIHSNVLVSSDPRFAAAIRDVRRSISALGLPVTETTSAGGHSVLITIMASQPADPAGASRLAAALTRVPAVLAATQRTYPGLTIAEAGDISANSAQDQIVNANLRRVELLAIPVTLAVLLLASGSVVAAAVPLLLGLTAVAAGLGALGPVSHLFPVQDSAKTVILLIGLAVGVDYALFYVARSREERQSGAAQRQALETTSRTSGRTVVISGSIVALAMAGMFVPGLKVLNGIAAGTIAVIFCAVTGSVTVLPAVLTLLGPKIDAGRVRIPRRRPGHGGPRRPSPAGPVLRRLLAAAGLAAALLLALAFPALSMRMAQPSSIALTAPDDPALRALATVQDTFPGAGEPAYVVVQVPASERGALGSGLARLEALAASDGIAHPPFQFTWDADHTAVALSLPLTGNGANPASRQAVGTLRRGLVPETVGQIPGAAAYVTGATAQDIDFTGQVARSLPSAIAFVLVLAFGLLMVAFRSVIVPLTALVLNLMSVAAAYGVLVVVFQQRWAEPILRFRSNGTITSWLPLFLFVVLFGLSMDYHIFILSRVREAVTGGEPIRQAIRHSLRRTAGVITAAALVMVCVFALFGTLASLDLKQAGVGLAVAVLIDATVIRSVLLPATMTVLGERNWYLPRWLDWLPQVGLEAPAARVGGRGYGLFAGRLRPRSMSSYRRDAKMTAAGHRYDAIVVGARCAGAATAMLLARRGFDVLLVDRARFPSEIPHGHYVRMHGPPRLAAWGMLDRVLATGCPPITSITMDLGDFPLTGRGLVVDGVPVGVAPRRAALDKVLVDAAIEAGAEFRDGFSVHDLTFDDNRVTGIRGRGGLAERARFVIGADGRNSRIAKRVGAPAYAQQPTLACWYFSYWSGVPWEGLEMYRRGHRMIFGHPTNDGLFAVFVGWPIAELPAVRSDIEAQMMAVIDRVPELSERIRSGRREERIYGAAQLPNFLRKPYGPGWALVGDAGCHKDPARALGICDALRDAELLADSLTASLSGRQAEAAALSGYERRRNEATMDDYEANLRAARFGPPPPEILQARAEARHDPRAMAQFCLAWEGRISRHTSAAGLYEPPRA